MFHLPARDSAKVQPMALTMLLVDTGHIGQHVLKQKLYKIKDGQSFKASALFTKQLMSNM